MPQLPFSIQEVSLDVGVDCPISSVQFIQADTSFVQLKLCLPIDHLTTVEKAYLVLFQELLFESDVDISAPPVLSTSSYPTIPPFKNNSLLSLDTEMKISNSVDASFLHPIASTTSKLSYQELQKLLSSQFTYHDAGIGFGNETFSCGWLSDVFIMNGCSMPGVNPATFLFEESNVNHVDVENEDSRMETSETKDVKMGKTGMKDAKIETTQTKNTKDAHLKSMVDALFNMQTWLISILSKSHFDVNRCKSIVKNLQSSIVECKRDASSVLASAVTCFALNSTSSISTTSSSITGNSGGFRSIGLDALMSIFHQDSILESIRVDLEHHDGVETLRVLNQLQHQLLAPSKSSSAFMQVIFPSADSDTSKAMKKCIETFWRSRVTSTDISAPLISPPKPLPSPFPLKRSSFHLASHHVDPAILIPLPSASSSYLIQLVPCDILDTDDFAPLLLLTNYLSMTEGPIYSAIRGPGFAYGASLSCALWQGYLAFEVYDAIDVFSALRAFWTLLESWKRVDDSSLSTLFTPALASSIYKCVAEKSTVGGLCDFLLKELIRGSRGSVQLEVELYRVTDKQLQCVFDRYLLQFLDPSKYVCSEDV